jgi:hypothetical protein
MMLSHSMNAGTIDAMPKRGSKADAADKAKKVRTADRHASPFMVRLPEVFREQLDAVRDQLYAEHRYRPPYTVLVQQALEDYLRERGLWPPPPADPS